MTLHWAIVFLVIALFAGFFGFAGVASLSWEGAKILFVIFLILACCPSWDMASAGGGSSNNGTANGKRKRTKRREPAGAIAQG